MAIILVPGAFIQLFFIWHILTHRVLAQLSKHDEKLSTQTILWHMAMEILIYAKAQWVEVLTCILFVDASFLWVHFVTEVKANAVTKSGDNFWIQETFTNMAIYTDNLINVSAYYTKVSSNPSRCRLVQSSPTPLHQSGQLYSQYKSEMALIIVCLSIRILKLVQFQPHLSFFSCTIKQCESDLANFIGLFSILFVGFTASAWLLFGHQLTTYKTWSKSSMTNLNFILGEFDWDGMLAAAPQGAYIYYILFIVIIDLVLFNVLLVTHTHIRAHARILRGRTCS